MKFWRVTETENERGWGQRTETLGYYLTEKEAKDRAHETNKHNTASSAPDIYWRADVEVVVIEDELVDLIVKEHKARKRKPAKK